MDSKAWVQASAALVQVLAQVLEPAQALAEPISTRCQLSSRAPYPLRRTPQLRRLSLRQRMQGRLFRVP
jgi:hypothetical protein